MRIFIGKCQGGNFMKSKLLLFKEGFDSEFRRCFPVCFALAFLVLFASGLTFVSWLICEAFNTVNECIGYLICVVFVIIMFPFGIAILSGINAIFNKKE